MGATTDNFLALSYTEELNPELGDGSTFKVYTYYNIASDFVNPFGGETAHFQIVKTVYGTGDQIVNITPQTPLPVQPFGSWTRYDWLANSGYFSLATTIVGYTGDPFRVVGVSGGEPVYVSITNDLKITAGDTLPIRNLSAVDASSGETSGDWVGVRGIVGGYPVGITFSGDLPVAITSLGNVGIFGVSGATAIGVTFGQVNVRGLSADTDSITVRGGGTGDTVYAGIYGYEGGQTAAPIYAENNALDVNIKQSVGVTVSASSLDIRDLEYTQDSVLVYGTGNPDQFSNATFPTYINAIDSNETLFPIGGSTGAGWCGAALNVFLVNQGITFEINSSITFDTEMRVGAPQDDPMPVHGTTYATTGVWVTGSTMGGPVIVQGFNNGLLPVDVVGFNQLLPIIGTGLQSLIDTTSYIISLKRALYSASVAEGAFASPPDQSLYGLISGPINDGVKDVRNTVISSPTQSSIGVTVVASKRQPSFMSRTGFAGAVSTNLSAYNGGNGFTCESGVKIKVSRIATGANSSQNEHMCIISEADAAVFGNTNTASAYMMYHGDEMCFEVDNINKIRVFYPALSLESAPFNTGSGVTFSFYAS
jgi:hypothetical protein